MAFDPRQPLAAASRYKGIGATARSSAQAATGEGTSDVNVLMRKGLPASVRRGVAAVVAGLVIAMAEPPMAAAGSGNPVAKGVSAAASSPTDISARRRHYHRGNAAGLAIMGTMIGTMGAAIAAQQRRDAYYNYYGYGPGCYGPPPVYYGPPAYGYGPYHGRRFYRYYPY
jgi:hypothetical protein